MNIRKATVYDAPICTAMWYKMKSETEYIPNAEARELFYINFIARVKMPNWSIYVAEEDGVVGFVMSEANYAEYSRSKAEGFCENVYVEKAYRSNGIMDKLLQANFDDAIGMGIKDFEFITQYDPRLLKVWEKKGYTPYRIVFRKEVN